MTDFIYGHVFLDNVDAYVADKALYGIGTQTRGVSITAVRSLTTFITYQTHLCQIVDVRDKPTHVSALLHHLKQWRRGGCMYVCMYMALN